jgi:hypothetical protein
MGLFLTFSRGGLPFHSGAPRARWTGKANFITPKSLAGNVDADPERREVFQLSTFRSQGQFNTTVYSDRDRFRGVTGTRMVLFMNRNDIDRPSSAIRSMARSATVLVNGTVPNDRLIAFGSPRRTDYHRSRLPSVDAWRL